MRSLAATPYRRPFAFGPKLTIDGLRRGLTLGWALGWGLGLLLGSGLGLGLGLGLEPLVARGAGASRSPPPPLGSLPAASVHLSAEPLGCGVFETIGESSEKLDRRARELGCGGSRR